MAVLATNWRNAGYRRKGGNTVMPPVDPRFGETYKKFDAVDPAASASKWTDALAGLANSGGNKLYNRQADTQIQAAGLRANQAQQAFNARGGRNMGRAGSLLAASAAEPGMADAQAQASALRTAGLGFDRDTITTQAGIDQRGIDQLLAAITGQQGVLRDETNLRREQFDADTRRSASERNQYTDLLDAVKQAGFITMPDGTRLSSSQLLRLLQGANVGNSFKINYPNDEDEG